MMIKMVRHARFTWRMSCSPGWILMKLQQVERSGGGEDKVSYGGWSGEVIKIKWLPRRTFFDTSASQNLPYQKSDATSIWLYPFRDRRRNNSQQTVWVLLREGKVYYSLLLISKLLSHTIRVIRVQQVMNICPYYYELEEKFACRACIQPLTTSADLFARHR